MKRLVLIALAFFPSFCVCIDDAFEDERVLYAIGGQKSVDDFQRPLACGLNMAARGMIIPVAACAGGSLPAYVIGRRVMHLSPMLAHGARLPAPPALTMPSIVLGASVAGAYAAEKWLDYCKQTIKDYNA